MGSQCMNTNSNKWSPLQIKRKDYISPSIFLIFFIFFFLYFFTDAVTLIYIPSKIMGIDAEDVVYIWVFTLCVCVCVIYSDVSMGMFLEKYFNRRFSSTAVRPRQKKHIKTNCEHILDKRLIHRVVHMFWFFTNLKNVHANKYEVKC